MQMTILMILALLPFGGSAPTAEGPEVGERAPDFELKDSKGKSYRLSELKGKNVVVEFIRSGSW